MRGFATDELRATVSAYANRFPNTTCENQGATTRYCAPLSRTQWHPSIHDLSRTPSMAKLVGVRGRFVVSSGERCSLALSSVCFRSLQTAEKLRVVHSAGDDYTRRRFDWAGVVATITISTQHEACCSHRIYARSGHMAHRRVAQGWLTHLSWTRTNAA